MSNSLFDLETRLKRVTSYPWMRAGKYITTTSGVVIAECESEDDAELLARAPEDLASLLEQYEEVEEEAGDLCMKVRDLETEIEDLRYENEELRKGIKE